MCSRHGGAVVGWNYFMTTAGPLQTSTVRARVYALLGIPLRRPRPSPMRLFVIDRAGKGERRSFQALVRRAVQSWHVCLWRRVCCL